MAIFWGCLAGGIAGAIGGFVAGLIHGDTRIFDSYVPGYEVAILLGGFTLFLGSILGGLVGLATGVINRPKLTWLLGLLMGILAAILLDFHAQSVLMSAIAGLIAAVAAGWRMTPKRAT